MSWYLARLRGGKCAQECFPLTHLSVAHNLSPTHSHLLTHTHTHTHTHTRTFSFSLSQGAGRGDDPEEAERAVGLGEPDLLG